MRVKILCAVLLTLMLASCGEYNKVLKSRDPELKYTYAKKYFDEKKYGRTTTLLEEILNSFAATSREEEVLFLLGQSYFYDKDYSAATARYTRYFNKFPKGEYAESARFNSAYGQHLEAPEIKLDQTSTVKSIQGFQSFLEHFPQSDKAKQAQDLMFEMQENLAQKELYSAQLYFNLGLFRGNNYESCVVTSREALKSYPFSKLAEEFQILIVRAKYELAHKSIDYRKPIRFRDVMDEHFNYMNMYPDGKYAKESSRYYRQAQKALGQEEGELEEEVKEING